MGLLGTSQSSPGGPLLAPTAGGCSRPTRRDERGGDVIPLAAQGHEPATYARRGPTSHKGAAGEASAALACPD
jgi:hypothetical protein